MRPNNRLKQIRSERLQSSKLLSNPAFKCSTRQRDTGAIVHAICVVSRSDFGESPFPEAVVGPLSDVPGNHRAPVAIVGLEGTLRGTTEPPELLLAATATLRGTTEPRSYRWV